MLKRDIFFTQIKQLGLFSTLSTMQVGGIEAVLNEWEKRKLTDLRWLAYMLATSYHETAKTMYPIEEIGKGKGHSYGGFRKRSGIVYNSPVKLYYGRGLVQLTWYENYELMGRLLGVDLLNKPELALNVPVAVEIMFEGMLRGSSSVGDFTGKCLEMYFNDRSADWYGARKIINGIDKAQLIADYGKLFYVALSAAAY